MNTLLSSSFSKKMAVLSIVANLTQLQKPVPDKIKACFLFVGYYPACIQLLLKLCSLINLYSVALIASMYRSVLLQIFLNSLFALEFKYFSREHDCHVPHGFCLCMYTLRFAELRLLVMYLNTGGQIFKSLIKCVCTKITQFQTRIF